ncbi:hypothetical protein KR054_012577, partial [Drosophila jambulina]
QTIFERNGNTFLSHSAGQIYTRPDGRTALMGSGGGQIITGGFDSPSGGNYNTNTNINNNNNVITNGHSTIVQDNGRDFIYGSAGEGSYINGREGFGVRIVNGGLEVTENGRVHSFPPKQNHRETVTINGQAAQVEYTNGDIIVELSDHTVIAKVGNRPFVGDRNTFDNRDRLEAEARNNSQRSQNEARSNFR